MQERASSAFLRRIRRIEITTRRAVEEGLSGRYHSVFRGRGIEFSEARAYTPGDDVRAIDWNVTARMGQPFVKRFVEERELTVMVLCDLSGSTDFGSREKTKAEVAAEIAALVAFSAVANGDRAGLLLFTDRVERFVPPRRGRKHALRLVSEILGAAPAGRGTDLGLALEVLGRLVPRRAVAFLLSDFLDRPERFERALRIAARRHDLVPVRLSDAREAALPATGLTYIEDPETGEAFTADLSDPRVRARFERARREEEERLHSLLARLSLAGTSVQAEASDPVRALLAFFAARARRRR